MRICRRLYECSKTLIANVLYLLSLHCKLQLFISSQNSQCTRNR